MSFLLIAGVLVVLCFGLAVLRGAPYLPTYGRDAEKLLDKCEISPNSTLLDLGSGDGKVLMAAAKRGMRAVGYEINPLLWLMSKLRLMPYRKLVKIHLGDMWQADIGKSDVIFVFLLDRLMGDLEAKLAKEAKPGAVVISYVFKLPNKKPHQKTRNAYIYKF